VIIQIVHQAIGVVHMAIVLIRTRVIGVVSVNSGGKENYVIDVSFTEFFLK
jgi:hypothetical protein